jgi:hypothetical protein
MDFLYLLKETLHATSGTQPDQNANDLGFRARQYEEFY